MKRMIMLFLVIAMSLSLCACGDNNSDAQRDVYEKYQAIIAHLENGNYQDAIDLIENMAEQDSNGSDSNSNSNTDSNSDSVASGLTPEQSAWKTNAVGTWIPDENASGDAHTGFTIKADGTCVVDGKDYTWTIGDASETNARVEVLDGQTKVHNLQLSINADYGYKRASLCTYTDAYSYQSTNGSYYRNEDYTVVEITNDNWQDYFEVKEVLGVTENAFGEASEFWGYTYFRLKDSYGTVNATLSSGGVEYQYISTCQDITVDLTNMTYVPTGEVHNTSEHNNTSELRSSTDTNDVRYYGTSVGSFCAYDVNKNLTDTVWRPLNIQILRVQGTFYIVKK